MTDAIDDDTLARDMIEVHGSMAAGVARDNARSAALAGQGIEARSWIRVLSIIQRRQGRHTSSIRAAAGPPSGDISGRK